MNRERFDELLFLYAADVREGCVVELGTYLGKGSISMAKGALSGYGAMVYTIDDYIGRSGCLGGSYSPSDKVRFEENVAEAGVDVTLIHKNHLDAVQDWNEPIGFLLWDSGDKDNLVRDWQNWRQHIVVGGKAMLNDTPKGDLGTWLVMRKLSLRGDFEVELFDDGVTVLRKCENDMHIVPVK